MHPTPATYRPLTRHFMRGVAERYISLPHLLQHSRKLMTIKDHVYVSKATAEGPGRSGVVRSTNNHPLQFSMAMPKTAGGRGDGPNPEQLFAMAYSACFLGSLKLAASRANKPEIAETARVTTYVYLGHPGKPDLPGFALRAEVVVEGCDDDSIICAANEFCPYSRALAHGIDIQVKKV